MARLSEVATALVRDGSAPVELILVTLFIEALRPRGMTGAVEGEHGVEIVEWGPEEHVVLNIWWRHPAEKIWVTLSSRTNGEARAVTVARCTRRAVILEAVTCTLEPFGIVPTIDPPRGDEEEDDES